MSGQQKGESRLDRLNEEAAQRARDFDARQEILRVKIESLRSSAIELHASVRQLCAKSERDGENIRALLRIAETRERRRTDLKGGEGGSE
jgi:hypothetical protein